MSRSSPLPKVVAGLGVAAMATTIRVAAAETPAPPPPADTAVDVVVHDALPPHRILVLEWNPLPLIIGKLSVNAVIAPGDHHALVLTPFYVSTTTVPVAVASCADAACDQSTSTQLPKQTFSGIGAEIGYRYYTGLGGPRGFFAGPSLIFGVMNAKPQVGDSLGYLDLGLAADVGYEMLVNDKLAITLGGGVQYTLPDKTIPTQQFPADIYANSRLAPRALASIGWAF
jgi:hypothetical protein